MCRIGCKDQIIRYGSAELLLKLSSKKFGPPLHTLIVPCQETLTPAEKEMLENWKVTEDMVDNEEEEEEEKKSEDESEEKND